MSGIRDELALQRHLQQLLDGELLGRHDDFRLALDLDLRHRSTLAKVDRIVIASVRVKSDSVYVEYVVEHSTDATCDGWHDSGELGRLVSGEMSERGWRFPVDVPLPERSTFEEL